MFPWRVTDASREAGQHVQLTDAEKQVLARVHERGERGLTIYEATGTYGLSREACQSVGRLGLVVDRDPIDGIRQVRAASVVVWLSREGTDRFYQLHHLASQHKLCCDHMIVLSCVCSYRSHCPVHGGGCHGTHD